MPFAQWGYPYKNKELFEKRYPAQFISEAIDQTRGWFYTLMAIGTLVFEKSSYENVVCLGHILAEDGRKMSKHLGNILEPIPLMDQHGADAVRWFMAAGGSPWTARRVGHGTIQEVVRKTLLTYWNTVAFQALYARTSSWAPSETDPAPERRPLLDRWLLSELHALVDQVTVAMEGYDTQRAGKLLSTFVDDLSNWYVRRSSRRFWQGDAAALRTLHDTLETITRLMAPIVPFVTERVWQDLIVPVTPGAPDSVHLADWPEADLEQGRPGAVAGHAPGAPPGRAGPRHPRRVRRQDPSAAVPRAGRRARVRDPLPRPAEPDHRGAQRQLRSRPSRRSADHWSTRPPRPTSVRWAAVSARAPRRSRRPSPTADAAALSAALREGTATVEVDGEQVALTPEEVIITETPREGWSVASDSGRHGRAGPGDHARAAPCGPGPGRDPPHPGGPQELGPGRRGPHRAALVLDGRGGRPGPDRPFRADRRGGPGHGLHARATRKHGPGLRPALRGRGALRSPSASARRSPPPSGPSHVGAPGASGAPTRSRAPDRSPEKAAQASRPHRGRRRPRTARGD